MEEKPFLSPSLEEVNRCQLYITKKRRYCKFPPTKGQNFCIQHLPRDEDGQFELNGQKRIPCPLDSNHSVFEHKLKSHLKKCSSKRIKPGDYFIEDVNSGGGSTEDSSIDEQTILLSEIDVEEVKALVSKISSIYQVHCQLERRIEEHEILKEDLSNPEHQRCLKHRKQEASLLGNMEKAGWLVDGTDYIEFGAGRARLSSYLLECIGSQSKSNVLLIDRDTTRNKCENRYKYLECGPSLERVRIDIKDLALELHPVSKNTHNEIVAYSKHLCGSATDLTLRCVQRVGRHDNSSVTVDSQAKKPRLECKRVKGVQIALCCHHRCTWAPYTGKEFWDTSGLTPRDLLIARTLSSWATCAFPDKDVAREDKSSHAVSTMSDKEFNRYSFWTSDEREKIGLQCKRVIDAGRASYLRQLGYKAMLVEYVGKAVSLENVMLVATPAGTQTISTPTANTQTVSTTTTNTGNQQLAENELLV